MLKRRFGVWTTVVFSWLVIMTGVTMAMAQPSPRARDLGVPFDGKPGPLNALPTSRE